MAPFTIESKRHEVLKSDLQTCHFLMENSTSHSEFQEILTVGFCDVLCIHICSMFRGKLFVSGRVSGVPLRIAVTTGIITCLIGDSKFKLNLLLPLLLGGRHTQTIYTHRLLLPESLQFGHVLRLFVWDASVETTGLRVKCK